MDRSTLQISHRTLRQREEYNRSITKFSSTWKVDSFAVIQHLTKLLDSIQDSSLVQKLHYQPASKQISLLILTFKDRKKHASSWLRKDKTTKISFQTPRLKAHPVGPWHDTQFDKRQVYWLNFCQAHTACWEATLVKRACSSGRRAHVIINLILWWS